VASYFDFGNGDLRVVHCDDPNCAGSNESIVTVDSGGGARASLDDGAAPGQRAVRIIGPPG
jgi:hypothetical protein